MERESILNELMSIIERIKDSTGWADLALIGSSLSAKGYNYKALGFLKLKDLLSDFPNNIETKIDNSHQVPIIYARVLSKDFKPDRVYTRSESYSKQDSRKLLSWAWMKDFRTTINTLKTLALKERWYYKSQNPKYPYPILTKYLTYTFYKLANENNKILKSGNFASFNTGLVDNRYEPIYALFEKNKLPGKQEWYFHEFCIPGEEKAGKNLTSNFNPLPDRANYFEKSTDMIYDIHAPEPQLDWNHIILENISRLPTEFLLDHCPTGFNLQDVSPMDTLQKKLYFRSLVTALENDNKTYRAIKNRFKDAVDLALKRVQWNYKTAIPMYYPKTDKLSLLLPLALLDEEIIDLALVVEKTRSGNYLGHTVLPLDWAYSNARLITRPDSDWLVAENIGHQTDADEIDDDSEIN